MGNVNNVTYFAWMEHLRDLFVFEHAPDTMVRARVAAAAERAVDVDAVGIGDEGVDRFRQENAQVLQGEARREVRS